MREYHQKRAAAAVTQCPRCGVASANFVRGVCRACYMGSYHQRRSAAVAKNQQMVIETPTLGDSEGQRLCVECKALGIYAHGLCRNCYMRDYMRDYVRGYVRGNTRDRQRRQRFCVECGAPGIYARTLCQNCYMRERRRDQRIKHRACAVCDVSFQSVRRDALYCSLSCRQKAHRAGKAQLFPKQAHGSERGAVQSPIEMQDATLAPRIEVQAHAVADLDRRQIDSIIEEAAKRGRTNGVLPAIDGELKARQVLAGERRREASTLTDLKAERATLGANGRQIEAEAVPTRGVAKGIGGDTDSEGAIRWLLALMLLCCDPPAIAPTAAARNGPEHDVALRKIMDNVVRGAD
jgi:ribosomal protein L37E